MININNKELLNYDLIDQGTFGVVYKVNDDIAYKVYKTHIRNIMNIQMNNPNLTTRKSHYDILLKRKNKIKESDLIEDILYIDNKFKGVVIKYYDGPNMKKTKDYSFDFRFKVARELINKAKELDRNMIYHTDYRPRNIIVTDDGIKLIDLDDLKTHAFIYPSPLFHYFSVKELGNGIQDLLGAKDHHPLPKKVIKTLSRDKRKKLTTYHSINKYINNKEKGIDVLFIDKDTDISKLKDNTNTYNTNIVYSIEDIDKRYEEEYCLSIINNLKMYNIPIYLINSKYLEITALNPFLNVPKYVEVVSNKLSKSISVDVLLSIFCAIDVISLFK